MLRYISMSDMVPSLYECVVLVIQSDLNHVTVSIEVCMFNQQYEDGLVSLKLVMMMFCMKS